MKKKFILSAILSVLTFSLLLAQVPQLINYQAVARNSSGEVLHNQTIGVKLTIHAGSESGPIDYAETHTVTTNDFGVFTLKIGSGEIVSGNFKGINWGDNSRYLQVEMDAFGGTNFVNMGTSELLSVPYALYSLNGAPGPQGPEGPAGPQGEQGIVKAISGSGYCNTPAEAGVITWSGPKMALYVNSPLQKILLIATITMGSTSGASGLDIWPAFAPFSGSGPITYGGGTFGLSVSVNERNTFTVTAIITNLVPGSYYFGGAVRVSNTEQWNNNEWGDVSAVLMN